MECDWTFSWLPLHVYFRWGVALVGEFSSGHCSPRRGTLFQVQGVYREMSLLRGCDSEGGRRVVFSNIFVKSVFYKRIFIKLFWIIVYIVGYVIMVRGP